MRPNLKLSDKFELEGVLLGMVLASAGSPQDSDLPLLYGSGIRYEREDQEAWKMPRQTLLSRRGDCEDLAVYRAAELRRLGIDRHARPIIIRTGPFTLHAIVQRGNGTREDPSRALGMIRLGEVPGSSSAMLPAGSSSAMFPAGSSSAMFPAGSSSAFFGGAGVAPGQDPLAMVASLYPGAGLVLKLLQNPKTRKMIFKAAKQIARFF